LFALGLFCPSNPEEEMCRLEECHVAKQLMKKALPISPHKKQVVSGVLATIHPVLDVVSAPVVWNRSTFSLEHRAVLFHRVASTNSQGESCVHPSREGW